MARRRMIDPNFWSSEDVAKLTIQQRLLLVGLFSNADDEGKGKSKPAFVRSAIFPYDDISLHEIIDDLETIRAVISIEFYEVEGSSYYKFNNWTKWQRVDKPQKSIIPEPDGTVSDNDSKNHSKNDSKNEDVATPESLLPKGKEKKLKERNLYMQYIYLSDSEYEGLKEKIPADELEDLMHEYNTYLANNPKKRNGDANLTIQNWWRRNNKKPKVNVGTHQKQNRGMQIGNDYEQIPFTGFVNPDLLPKGV